MTYRSVHSRQSPRQWYGNVAVLPARAPTRSIMTTLYATPAACRRLERPVAAGADAARQPSSIQAARAAVTSELGETGQLGERVIEQAADSRRGGAAAHELAVVADGGAQGGHRGIADVGVGTGLALFRLAAIPLAQSHPFNFPNGPVTLATTWRTRPLPGGHQPTAPGSTGCTPVPS